MIFFFCVNEKKDHYLFEKFYKKQFGYYDEITLNDK